MEFPPNIAPGQGDQARQERDGITPDSAAARILESITDAFFALDTDWRFTYLNAQAERLLGRTGAELLGRNVWEEFPAAVGSTFDREYHRAVAEGVSVSFEAYYPPPLDAWFEVRAFPSPEGLSVFFQNVSKRRRAEEALRESHEALRRSREDLSLAVEAARLGTFYCDYPLDRIVWNETCKRHFFLPPDAEVDFALFYSLLHPDDREPTRQAIGRALAERVAYDVEYRTLAPDGRTRWVNAVGRFYYDDGGNPTRFDGVTLDVSARKAAEEELRARAERERFLADLAERARTLTDPDEVIADAVRSVGHFLHVDRCVFADIDIAADTCTVPPDYLADETVASMAGTFPISAFGPFLVREYGAGRTVVADDVRLDPVRFPADYVGAYGAVGIRAFVAVPVLHSSRLVSVIAAHSASGRRWRPEEVELLQAVAERTWLTVEVTRQERALAREAAALRQSEARYRAVFDALAEGITVQDATGLWQEANASAERILALSRGQMAGRTSADPRWRAVSEDGSTLPGEEHPPMVALRTGQPVRDMLMGIHRPDGTLVWLSANAELIRDSETGEPMGVVTSFFDVTAQREAQQDMKAHAERERLFNRMNDVIRATNDPERIRETAAALVGEALGADRSFYVTYNPTGGDANVSQDWHRTDLPSIAGGYRASDFGPLLEELFPEPRTAVVADVREAFSLAVASMFEAYRHRAVLVVPFFDGGALVAALYVSMADAPRSWLGDEVALVEQVATLTRSSLEAALLQEREHRIAQQLQDALQPAVPERVPGLSVGRFTRPALDEAQVGGDFYDLFPLDKNLFAIVIGDVSGKGLAAAQQLALIRNSLRTTLYLSRAPAQAASALNTIVTSHDLLVGFVTAWVGVYDAATGQMRYCSCGHEPGLVRRAGGRVEVTETTGPPLGVAEGAEYGEGAVTLSPGDALLLYTDGLSESGPSRRDLLGTDGLMRLLAGLEAGMGVQAEADALFRDVSAYTNGVFRDDVALLLLRRE